MTNFLYNPDRKSKEQLIAEFVVRTDVYDEIMHDLETSDMKTPEQHYLLVGQRGSGKTTLLNRIKYGVEESEKLNQWLIPVIFSEEQYNISELVNLWENVGQILEDYNDFEGISGKMEPHIDSDERVYDILERELKKRKKKIVLLIDNIGDFLKKLDDKEVRRLREILQTKPDIRLIAGSAFYLESILDYKQPFFEFFKMIRLDGLSQSETQRLLRTLGDVFGEKEKITTIINERPERIETLRVLTGGVPRTIALMFRIFVDYEHESSIRDLERVLDAVTPLYKHRMDDLPTQQQKIVDAVAKKWDPISVKELRDKVRLDSKIISAQLRQLEKNQIVEKRETETKNHLYLLNERFFNIWYLLRYGRKQDRKRVIWLVRFLESWCTHSDIEQKILAFIEEIKNQKITEEHIEFFGDVYSSLQNLTLFAKSTLREGIPHKFSRHIIFTTEELDKLSQQYLADKKFIDAILVLSEIDNLEESHKTLLIVAFIGLVKQNNEWIKRIIDTEVIPKWLDKNQFLNKSQLNIVVIALLVTLCQGVDRIDTIPADQIMGALKSVLILMEKLYEIDSFSSLAQNKITTEITLLIYPLKRFHEHMYYDSVINIFETSISSDSNLKIMLEPVYQSLLIIANKSDYSRVPLEKEQLIRNIVERITSKD